MDQDVEAVGAHCQYKYCHQLDFLPFRCESCKGTFCLDHRTETGHECAKAGAWAASRRDNSSSTPRPTTGKPTLATGTQCSHPSCKTFINTHSSVGVACTSCSRTYCLKHRLREDHDCSKLTPIGARTAGTTATTTTTTGADKARAALTRLRAWGKEKQAAAANIQFSKSARASTAAAANATAALNALKRTAKGDANVPLEKRIYLHVEAEATPAPASSSGAAAVSKTSSPKGAFYYSREWSVGRLLDAAAKSLQVENVNNRRDGEEERLRVFHVEAGRVLGFSEKVGECCKNGETVVLLRGAGAG